MAVLTGPEIEYLVNGGWGERGERISIRPFDRKFVGPASYDVHLGEWIAWYGDDSDDPDYKTPLDPLNPPALVRVKIDPDRGLVLYPDVVYLANTVEYMETEKLEPILHGRSSIGRLGLFVHVTAGFGDPGWRGHWTLELVATQPIIVRPGMKIAQVSFETMVGEDRAYCGRYQDQPAEPIPSRYNLNRE